MASKFYEEIILSYNNGFKDGLMFASMFPDEIDDALEFVNGR